MFTKLSKILLSLAIVLAGCTSNGVIDNQATTYQEPLFGSAPSSFYVGDGSDGSKTVNSAVDEDSVKSNITSTANSGQKDVVLNSATGFSADDWVFIIQIQGTGNGGYEFGQIESISTNTLTMKGNLINTYQSTGAQVIKVFEYSSVTVASGGTWSASDWNGTTGGVLVAMITGDLTVSSGGSIDVNGIGFRGGAGGTNNAGTQGESAVGTGSVSTAANGAGGGGGQGPSFPQQNGGGGGGHSASGATGGTISGTPGTGGGTDGSADLTDLVFGGAGGGGGWFAGSASAGGDSAGMAVFVVGGNVSISDNVSADGNNSGSAQNTGGGGSGGAIFFASEGTVALGTSNVTAENGIGTAASGGATGGNGADGRVATLSGSTVTGTSVPTIDETNTATLTTTNPYDPIPLGDGQLKIK